VNKNIEYIIIASNIGSPPIDSIMKWDKIHDDAWFVKNAYFYGSISLFHGDPALFPKIYEPYNIKRGMLTEKMKKIE